MPQSITTKDRLKKANEAEAAQQFEQAAEIYEQILEDDNLEVEAYNRVMIVYRKLKDYKSELAVVDRGIAAYQYFYNLKTSKSKRVVDINHKLAKSMGLVDRRVTQLTTPEPLGKWTKRKLVIEKRIKPKKK